MTVEVVKGKTATIYFDAQKCVHSRGRVLSHPVVFGPNVVGEWIHPDAQSNAELLHVAADSTGRRNTLTAAWAAGVLQMKYRTRTFYTACGFNRSSQPIR